MKKTINDFKKFITKGNILDLAVAVVIAGAFGKIITSLVNDILTPIISLVVGPKGFVNYKYVVSPANEALGISENAIYYGKFLQNTLDFFIIAVIIFLIVKAINKANQLIEKSQDVLIDVKPKMEDVLLDIKSILGENSSESK